MDDLGLSRKSLNPENSDSDKNFTHFLPLCSNYKEIEMALLNEFGERLKPGEHLRGVNFEEVCAVLEKQPFSVPKTSS